MGKGRSGGEEVKRVFRLFAAVVMASAVSGCTSISYYAQSLEGHVRIM
ncbi:aminopeptidase, partial [Mesorhizobium sp. M2D.F.Ca.ET.145.01.1.1]